MCIFCVLCVYILEDSHLRAHSCWAFGVVDIPLIMDMNIKRH